VRFAGFTFPINHGRSKVKEFMLGFFVALSLSMAGYIAWEHHRHVPVVIQQVPVPVKMIPQSMGPFTGDPDIETWNS